MKNYIMFIFVALSSIMLSGCFDLERADAGEEVVFVKKPWFFGSGGTVEEPLTDGSVWKAWSTSAYKYEIRPTRYEESFEDIFTSNNVPLGFNAAIILEIHEGTTPQLHSNFGKGWYENNVQNEFVARVRNTVRGQISTDVVNNPNTNEDIQSQVKSHMQDYIDGIGMTVNVRSVIMGRATPPDEVLEQIAATAAQDERERTETNRTKAEKAREAAERQKAVSDMAYMNQMNFNPAEYIAMRKIEIEREKIELVRNKENVHIIVQSGDGSSPQAMFGVDK